MTETELKETIARIASPDEAARAAAHAHWAKLAKPLGGLGRLETMIEDAAALTGREDIVVSRRAVFVLCADNGVVAQGVSPVSYTHLEVYKRQARKPCARPSAQGRCNARSPLSGRQSETHTGDNPGEPPDSSRPRGWCCRRRPRPFPE